jgi:Zn-dependent protease with chaperone function/Zn-finger nucleic acid-binding protein
VVEEMRLAAGLREKIQPVISNLVSVNAFTATDQRHGAVIGVTEGLLGKLDREQLQCVVAHEIAHLRSGDAALTTLICSMSVPFVTLYEKLRASRENLQDMRSRASSSIGLVEAYLFIVVLILRLLATLVERQRELRADTEAVELTRNPVALAEAIWIATRENHFVCDDLIGNAYAPIFIADPTSGPGGGREGLLAELFTTHPPLSRRLEPLLEMAVISMPTLLDRLENKSSLRQNTYSSVKEDVPLDSMVETPDRWANGGTGRCPLCGISLEFDRWSGVLIASCPQGHGRLVENSKMVRVLSRATWKANTISTEEAAAFFRKNYLRSKPPTLSDPKPKLLCPRCNQTMMRSYFSYQFNVVVDRCFVCDVTWFDTNELEMLYKLQHLCQE